MLREIRIRDLGVIEDAVIELGPGLTVLTGETGAGKTMVVTGLGLLLGERADSGLVRAGARRAVVEGILDLPDGHPALRRAADAGGEVDDGLVLVRSVSAEGRSRAHVGGSAAPVGVLADLAELIVAVHGQADQWRLRRGEEHREVLDASGGEVLHGTLAAYREVHERHHEASTELEALRTRAHERAQEADALRTGLERIEALDPQPGEDAALRAEDERLGRGEELRAAASEALLHVAGDDGSYAAGADGVVGALARARSAMTPVHGADPVLADLERRVVELGHLAAEVGSDLSGYLADLDADPGRLEWVQARRAALAGLTRLYGDTVDDVLAWARTAAVRHTELLGASDRVGELEAEVADLDDRRARAAHDLTAARREAATLLGARITEELSHLAMGSAEVAVHVGDAGRFTADGADDIEIRLAANAGTLARSVVKAASGGELSRVMLAIEVATAGEHRATVPTFVFDEVDAGVGGRAALDVGARLAALSRHAQVVVVTHLAQVAAHADRHLVVRKADDGHVTRSGVVPVDGDERVAELARMLAGTVSEAALEHARDLLMRVRGEIGPDTEA